MINRIPKRTNLSLPTTVSDALSYGEQVCKLQETTDGVTDVVNEAIDEINNSLEEVKKYNDRVSTNREDIDRLFDGAGPYVKSNVNNTTIDNNDGIDITQGAMSKLHIEPHSISTASGNIEISAPENLSLSAKEISFNNAKVETRGYATAVTTNNTVVEYPNDLTSKSYVDTAVKNLQDAVDDFISGDSSLPYVHETEDNLSVTNSGGTLNLQTGSTDTLHIGTDGTSMNALQYNISNSGNIDVSASQVDINNTSFTEEGINANTLTVGGTTQVTGAGMTGGVDSKIVINGVELSADTVTGNVDAGTVKVTNTLNTRNILGTSGNLAIRSANGTIDMFTSGGGLTNILGLKDPQNNTSPVTLNYAENNYARVSTMLEAQSQIQITRIGKSALVMELKNLTIEGTDTFETTMTTNYNGSYYFNIVAMETNSGALALLQVNIINNMLHIQATAPGIYRGTGFGAVIN